MKRRVWIFLLLGLLTCLISVFFVACTEENNAKNGLTFNTLTVEESTVYGTVANDVETFSFIDEIQTEGKTKFTVSLDVYGSQIVATKTIPLEIGDNVVYITELIGDEPKNVFTVTIRRRAMFDVTFYTNVGTSIESQVVEEGSPAVEPANPERAGYTFTGWNYDFTTPITQNTRIMAYWEANEDTKYMVNYYLQNLNGSNYTLHETIELEGKTDTTATAKIKDYAHFTYNADKSVISGNINGDGSRILSVYYMRDNYTIYTERNYTKAGTVTGSGAYCFEKEIVLTASTNAGYTFLGWYEGEKLVCETEEFIFNAEKNITYTATWIANTDTKYTVVYYWQNIDDDNYTLLETIELKGETDTTVTAEIKEYDHFTYCASISTVTGNIDGDGSRLLSVYYTRDTYLVNVNKNNENAGNVTGSGTYRFDGTANLKAITNAGYTWLGWFAGGNLICQTEEFAFKVERTTAYTAKWQANVDTKYTVNYYLQNLDDDNYTLYEYEEFRGTTDTSTGEADIKEYVHFTYNAAISTISGNVDGDGSCALSVYYTRNVYKLSMNNSSAGYITKAGNYKYGKEVSTKATLYLGYNFLGWYSGDELLSTNLSDTFTISQNIIAKFQVKAEMTKFNFTSTSTTCSITDVKTKTAERIVVPDYVTYIPKGAFSGCSNLTEVTLPFVGESKKTKYPFGYIFGSYSYADSTQIKQEHYDSGSGTLSWYYLPNSLEKVIITGGDIFYGAFYGCERLTEIVIPDDATLIDKYAFYYCSSLTKISIGDKVKTVGNKAFYGCSSLTNVEIGEGVTMIDEEAFGYCSSLMSIVIPDSVTTIGDAIFNTCSKLENVVIGSGVTMIGRSAFYSCDGLKRITFNDTSTWYKTTSLSNCTNKTGGTEINVTTPTSNASSFKSTFYDGNSSYYWYKL